jgi:hypothetical protein
VLGNGGAVKAMAGGGAHVVWRPRPQFLGFRPSREDLDPFVDVDASELLSDGVI